MFNLSNSISQRKTFWKKVHQQLEVCTAHCQMGLNIGEAEIVRQFQEGRLDWKSFIPAEWIEIYGALYDEGKKLKIDDREKVKIEKDVKRTFGLFLNTASSEFSASPTSSSFSLSSMLVFEKASSPLALKLEKHCQSLQNVLFLLSHQRSYSQGINFLAGYFILSNVPERDCFIYLSFLLRQCCLEILFDSKFPCLFEYMMLFQKKLRSHNRAVYSHLKAIGFDTVCYGIEWFTTCFLVTTPGILSYSIIDLLFSSHCVADIMLRVGLAVMDLLNDKILSLDCEEMQLTFRSLIRSLNPVDVVVKALMVQFRYHNSYDLDYLQLMSMHVDQLNELPDQSLLSVRQPLKHVTVLRRKITPHPTPVATVHNTTANNESSVEDGEDSMHEDTCFQSELYAQDVYGNGYDADIDKKCHQCRLFATQRNTINQKHADCHQPKHSSQQLNHRHIRNRMRQCSSHELHIRLSWKLKRINDELRQRCAPVVYQLSSRSRTVGSAESKLTANYAAREHLNGRFHIISSNKTSRFTIRINDNANNSTVKPTPPSSHHPSSFSLIHPVTNTLATLFQPTPPPPPPRPTHTLIDSSVSASAAAIATTTLTSIEVVLVAKGLYLPRQVFPPTHLTRSINALAPSLSLSRSILPRESSSNNHNKGGNCKCSGNHKRWQYPSNYNSQSYEGHPSYNHSNANRVVTIDNDDDCDCDGSSSSGDDSISHHRIDDKAYHDKPHINHKLLIDRDAGAHTFQHSSKSLTQQFPKTSSSSSSSSSLPLTQGGGIFNWTSPPSDLFTFFGNTITATAADTTVTASVPVFFGAKSINPVAAAVDASLMRNSSRQYLGHNNSSSSSKSSYADNNCVALDRLIIENYKQQQQQQQQQQHSNRCNRKPISANRRLNDSNTSSVLLQRLRDNHHSDRRCKRSATAATSNMTFLFKNGMTMPIIRRKKKIHDRSKKQYNNNDDDDDDDSFTAKNSNIIKNNNNALPLNNEIITSNSNLMMNAANCSSDKLSSALPALPHSLLKSSSSFTSQLLPEHFQQPTLQSLHSAASSPIVLERRICHKKGTQLLRPISYSDVTNNTSISQSHSSGSGCSNQWRRTSDTHYANNDVFDKCSYIASENRLINTTPKTDANGAVIVSPRNSVNISSSKTSATHLSRSNDRSDAGVATLMSHYSLSLSLSQSQQSLSPHSSPRTPVSLQQERQQRQHHHHHQQQQQQKQRNSLADHDIPTKTSSSSSSSSSPVLVTPTDITPKTSSAIPPTNWMSTSVTAALRASGLGLFLTGSSETIGSNNTSTPSPRSPILPLNSQQRNLSSYRKQQYRVSSSNSSSSVNNSRSTLNHSSNTNNGGDSSNSMTTSPALSFDHACDDSSDIPATVTTTEAAAILTAEYLYDEENLTEEIEKEVDEEEK